MVLCACVCVCVCVCVCAWQPVLSSFAAVLRSRPRLIDLHYFIVQRLPPASRPYASAFCFTLGLPVQLYSGDDKFHITAVFQKWLECGSCIPRTWGALLSAMKRDFCFEDIPAKWIEEITKDLICECIS